MKTLKQMWSRIKAIIAFLSTRELETVPLSHSGDILVTPFWCPVLDIHLRQLQAGLQVWDMWLPQFYFMGLMSGPISSHI